MVLLVVNLDVNDHQVNLRPVINRLCLLLYVLPCLTGAAKSDNTFIRTEDVIYGRKSGTALTLDVFTPAVTNGIGILCIVSSGYVSSHEAINPAYYHSLLARGYTVFAVVHGSSPKFSLPEMELDVLRAVQFVRHHSARYGVDPKRLGAIGASAGGHLSLTLVTKGGPGSKSGNDPVNRESSAVQCAACFFPPTDYLNYGAPGRESEWVEPLLGLNKSDPNLDVAKEGRKLRRNISPIYFIHSNQPPVLIIQGTKDYLVPVEQAETFIKRSEEVGAKTKLVIKPGKGHGWWNMAPDMEVAVDWFDQHLRGLKAREN